MGWWGAPHFGMRFGGGIPPPGDGIFNVDGESWFKQRPWDAQVQQPEIFRELIDSEVS